MPDVIINLRKLYRFKKKKRMSNWSCVAKGRIWILCSCLESPRDRGAWWAAVFGVTQSWTRLKWRSSSSMYLKIKNKSLHHQVLGTPFPAPQMSWFYTLCTWFLVALMQGNAVTLLAYQFYFVVFLVNFVVFFVWLFCFLTWDTVYIQNMFYKVTT